MKTLIQAHSFEVIREGREFRLQFYDSKKKTLKGEDCYWDGSLAISYLNLTTLKGCPYEITEDFSCGNNPLKNLQGCPQIIRGNFRCLDTNIQNLIGGPIFVGKQYSVAYNKQLISLEGCPENIKDHFNCSANNLTNLKHSPLRVGGHFNCSYNQLTSLEGIPLYIIENLDIRENKLTSLDELLQVKTNLDIDARGNMIVVKSDDKKMINFYKRNNIEFKILEESRLSNL